MAGIGIAAAGQIHPKTHAVVYAAQPRSGSNVPLRDEIESAFGMPVYVENDVRLPPGANIVSGQGGERKA